MEVWVFESNLAGLHISPSAIRAVKEFGAVDGNGIGRQGMSYAIPAMQGGIETIRPYVDEFLGYADTHREARFLVPEIGCELGGFDATEVAPLFRAARSMVNVALPLSFRTL